MVNIDLIGLLPTVMRGHKYIIIVIDHLKKWVDATSSSSDSAKFIDSFLLQIMFSCHGSPNMLLSDNGNLS